MERINERHAFLPAQVRSGNQTNGRQRKGSIEAGKIADFLVVDRQVLNIGPEALEDVKVLETFVGGSRCTNSTEGNRCSRVKQWDCVVACSAQWYGHLSAESPPDSVLTPES